MVDRYIDRRHKHFVNVLLKTGASIQGITLMTEEEVLKAVESAHERGMAGGPAFIQLQTRNEHDEPISINIAYENYMAHLYQEYIIHPQIEVPVPVGQKADRLHIQH